MSKQTPFLHIAYANNNTGTLDFSTTGGIPRTYTGFYTDEFSTASKEPSKYTWLTNADFEKKITNSAYANSTDGNDGFTTVYPNLNLLTDSKDFKNRSVAESQAATSITSPAPVLMTEGSDTFLRFTKRATDSQDWFRAYMIRGNSVSPNFPNVEVKPNSQYTFSVWLKGTGTHQIIAYNNWTSPTPTTLTVTLTDNWTRYSLTVVTSATIPTQGAQFFIRSSTLGSEINLKYPKVESGSTATSWLPASSEVMSDDYFPHYIGLSNKGNSTNPKEYSWSLLENLPTRTLIKHVAYANSLDGHTDFTTVYPNLNLLDGTSSGLKTVSANAWGTPGTLAPNHVNFIVGQSYTYSAWIQDCDVDTRAVIYITDGSGFNGYLGNTITAGSSGFSTVTFTVSTSVTNYEFSIGFMEYQSNNYNLSYSKLKLELGSIATPHMPSASEVKDSDYPKFVGIYGDDSQSSSNSPASYKWSSIPVPGPTPPIVPDITIPSMPTVKSINVLYGIGTVTNKPINWLSKQPVLKPNELLWYKLEITDVNDKVSSHYSISIGGAKLNDGDGPLIDHNVTMILNDKAVTIPKDLALKLELLMQLSDKRDNELAQLIADTNDRITNIDMGSGQSGLVQEIADRKAGDLALDTKINTTSGNVSDLETQTRAELDRVEKKLDTFSIQGANNITMKRPSIVFDYNAYGALLPDGSTDEGGRLYFQVPGDSSYNVRELKFNYQTTPSFYDQDQITIWEFNWSKLYGGFSWRDTIITNTDTDTFYIDGMITYYDMNGDLVIRGNIILDDYNDWIGSANNRGFRPDSVIIVINKDLKSIKQMKFSGDMGIIEMSINLGYSAIAQVQRIGKHVSFYGSSPIGTFSTTSSTWTALTEKILYGLRPTRSFEFAASAFGNNNTIQYAFDTNGSMKLHQATSMANQYQVMGQVSWETLDQYPPYGMTTQWRNR